jgi:DNA repair exonuclease SbcCD ATPase subunit
LEAQAVDHAPADELAAAMAALLASRDATQSLLHQLEDAELSLRQAQSRQEELLRAHTALEALFVEQSSGLRQQLEVSEQRLGDVLAAQQAWSTAAAEAERHAEQLSLVLAEHQALSEQLKAEASSCEARCTALQQENMRLRNVAAAAGLGMAGGEPTGRPAPPPQVAKPAPVPRTVPTVSTGCRITAANRAATAALL